MIPILNEEVGSYIRYLVIFAHAIGYSKTYQTIIILTIVSS
jgi:hypothetical protein